MLSIKQFIEIAIGSPMSKREALAHHALQTLTLPDDDKRKLAEDATFAMSDKIVEALGFTENFDEKFEQNHAETLEWQAYTMLNVFQNKMRESIKLLCKLGNKEEAFELHKQVLEAEKFTQEEILAELKNWDYDNQQSDCFIEMEDGWFLNLLKFDDAIQNEMIK